MFKFKIEGLKNWFWFLLNLFIIVSILITLLGVRAFNRYENSLPVTRTINVNGEGKVTVIPDIATFSFSVVSEGKDPNKITTDNNQKINSALDFIKGKGVEAKDIKTTSYSLSPKYEYDKVTRTTFISGYTLTQTVQVKIRDFSKIGDIMGALPGMGINQIGTLSFDVDNQDNYLNQARQIAFDKAFVKAKSMASQNHVRIERVVTFSESQNNYPIYFKTAMDSSSGMGGAVPSSAPQIEPGSQEVTVDVYVTYEIE